ncbi:MAG TPA: ABC transporter substrate-binding protein [Chthoniobacter sp.]|jgi:NitT/TauT family transport system substrate-binding protein
MPKFLHKSLRAVATALALLAPLAGARAQQVTLRVGYFPNITHAQGLVASQLTRQGKGWFESRLGDGVKIQWFAYNAGPSAMEAIAANSIDLTYVGPNPALNLYVKAEGDEVRIVAGSAEGGAALVVQPDGRITKPEDFRGKLIATPQLGNTQDVACRAWLKKQGYRVTQIGGDVKVVPAANPDQLALFTSKQLDGVWTVEPWVSRLELEAKGKIYLEQKDSITTVLVSSVKMLKQKPDLVKKFAAAHAELTDWINAHPDEAKKLVNAELKEITRREMSPELTDRAWSRLHFTSKIERQSLESFVADAKSAGFLRGSVDLSRLMAVP